MTSSPAGSSGSGTGARANVYNPAAQPAADALFQNILNPSISGSLGEQGVNPFGTPAGVAYGQATAPGGPLSTILDNTGYGNATTGTQLANQLGLSSNALAAGAAPQLASAGSSLLQGAPAAYTAFNNLGNQAGGYAQPLYDQLTGLSNQVTGLAPGYLSQMQGLSGQLSGLTSPIIQQAFDPQSALYNQQVNQLQQQIAAQNANTGVTGSPYGSDVANEALGNFNINWQNNLLNRMLQGGTAAQGLDTAAGNLLQAGTLGAGNLYQQGGQLANLGAQGAGSLLSTAGGLYGQGVNALGNLSTTGANLLGAGQTQYGTGIGNLLSGGGAQFNLNNQYGNAGLGALGNVASLGTSQYALPQQVLNDIESYLGLGQAASGISGQLGQLGQNQLATSLGGFGSLLGSGLGLGTPSNPGYLASGIGGLFGGAGAALPAANYATPLAGTLGGIADFGGGADLLPLLAAP